MRDARRSLIVAALAVCGLGLGATAAAAGAPPTAPPPTAGASTAPATPANTSAEPPNRTGVVLTVCADPNNMPFSNRAGDGFENRITQLIAHDLNMKVRYVWWAQRRGFVRNTLKDAKCDLWPGIAQGVDNVLTTRPYYRSTYVFVTRRSSSLSGLTLDDPRLRSLSIGVQMIGNDAMNTPPAHAIARRGVIRNVRGFMLYGNYGRPNPPARIVEAVARGAVDVAMVWGPLAGYFASRSPVPLRLEPVTPALDGGVWPMTYDIAMGVRRNEPQLHQQIEHVLASHKPQIDAILHAFGVPELPVDINFGSLARAR